MNARNQNAKEAIFNRIRAANGAGAIPAGARESARLQEHAVIARNYRRKGALPEDERIALFQSILKHYGAASWVVEGPDVAGTIGTVLAERGKKRLVAPPEFPSQWVPPGIEIVRDAGMNNDELDRIDGVITGCTVAIASTGSIALAGGRDGRRAITLVPDYHLCIVRLNQLVEFMAEALEALKELKTAPLTFVSGPSATVDIEMTRVQGVHGPRTLDVIICRE